MTGSEQRVESMEISHSVQSQLAVNDGSSKSEEARTGKVASNAQTWNLELGTWNLK